MYSLSTWSCPRRQPSWTGAAWCPRLRNLRLAAGLCHSRLSWCRSSAGIWTGSRRRGSGGLVFTGPKGAALRRSNFRPIWNAAMAKAGLSTKPRTTREPRLWPVCGPEPTERSSCRSLGSQGTAVELRIRVGAGEGNRTLMTSLEGRRSDRMSWHTPGQGQRGVSVSDRDSPLITFRSGTQRARPNLQIRRSRHIVQRRLLLLVRWADLPNPSPPVRRCSAAWQQYWQQFQRAKHRPSTRLCFGWKLSALCRGGPMSGPGRLPPDPCLLTGVFAVVSRVMRDFACTFTGTFGPVLVVLRSVALGAGGAGTYAERAIPGLEPSLRSVCARPGGGLGGVRASVGEP